MTLLQSIRAEGKSAEELVRYCHGGSHLATSLKTTELRDLGPTGATEPPLKTVTGSHPGVWVRSGEDPQMGIWCKLFAMEFILLGATSGVHGSSLRACPPAEPGSIPHSCQSLAKVGSHTQAQVEASAKLQVLAGGDGNSRLCLFMQGTRSRVLAVL